VEDELLARADGARPRARDGALDDVDGRVLDADRMPDHPGGTGGTVLPDGMAQALQDGSALPGGAARVLPESTRAAADLALPLAEIARMLREEQAPLDVVTAFVHEAARWVPGAEAVSITAVEASKRVTTAAASSPLAVEFDRMQYETGEGPCLTALFHDVMVRVGDLHVADERWPRFSELAARAELRSALALQLWSAGEEVGALNVFSRMPDAFDQASEQVALLFATHASLLLGTILRTGQLEQAVTSRDVIGMAKGMVMQRHSLDEATAFSVLVRYSRDSNTKLRDLAAKVVAEGGALPR
jgi:transcriptional regulator with GAF, ATPase, and Fis domain